MKYNSLGSQIVSVSVVFVAKMLSVFAFFALLGLSACLGSNNVYHLNERDFESHIRDKDIMLVDFFAPWCPHCQELSPELDAAADQLATKNQFVFAKVDCVNDGKQLCQRFNIQGFPTIKLFKYGQYVGDYVGQRDRGSLMQYVDSVASSFRQNEPLTTGVSTPLSLAQAINYKPHAQVFPSHHASATHAPAPVVAPTFMNHANLHQKNPSLMQSFYGSSTHAQQPGNTAAFLGSNPLLQQASPDSLQSKFGNLASLDVYRAKLKMIAAYKNYQRRLTEYRTKLTAASKANVNPRPQGYAGAVTRPPRPGVSAFAQPQPYRGYYRPEALAAQNVQINRAYPQAGFGVNTMSYPNRFASPYGYQAASSSPYYRSKTFHGRKRHHGKQRKPAPRPAAVRKPAYNPRQRTAQVNSQAAYYYKQQQQRQQQQYPQQPQQNQQQQFRQDEQQQQQFRQQPQRQQFQQESQQQSRQQPQGQDLQQEFSQQQQQQQQLQQEPHEDQTNYKQQQDNKKPQANQAEDKPAAPTPGQSNDSPTKPDTSALKDLKADIESAIQDALRNAVSKESEKTKASPTVHVDGERAKSHSPEQTDSGSGAQSHSDTAHGSGVVGEAVTGEVTGSGSGVKPDAR